MQSPRRRVGLTRTESFQVSLGEQAAWLRSGCVIKTGTGQYGMMEVTHPSTADGEACLLFRGMRVSSKGVEAEVWRDGVCDFLVRLIFAIEGFAY